VSCGAHSHVSKRAWSVCSQRHRQYYWQHACAVVDYAGYVIADALGACFARLQQAAHTAGCIVTAAAAQTYPLCRSTMLTILVADTLPTLSQTGTVGRAGTLFCIERWQFCTKSLCLMFYHSCLRVLSVLMNHRPAVVGHMGPPVGAPAVPDTSDAFLQGCMTKGRCCRMAPQAGKTLGAIYVAHCCCLCPRRCIITALAAAPHRPAQMGHLGTLVGAPAVACAVDAHQWQPRTRASQRGNPERVQPPLPNSASVWARLQSR
jgi:hypothetical protein